MEPHHGIRNKITSRVFQLLCQRLLETSICFLTVSIKEAKWFSRLWKQSTLAGISFLNSHGFMMEVSFKNATENNLVGRQGSRHLAYLDSQYQCQGESYHNTLTTKQKWKDCYIQSLMSHISASFWQVREALYKEHILRDELYVCWKTGGQIMCSMGNWGGLGKGCGNELDQWCRLS